MAWNQYVETREFNCLQKNCSPKLIQADSKVPFRGTIALYHGFTACPQQFFEWTQNYLSKSGFDVLLALLPGHGHEGLNQSMEDPMALPKRENWKALDLAETDEINHIMSLAAGTRIIGGVSVGAELAALAAFQNPTIYSRILLLSPFFRLSTETKEFNAEDPLWVRELQNIATFLHLNTTKPKLIDVISNPKNWFHSISNQIQTWGDGCKLTERGGYHGNAGRAGYCNFTLNAISAAQALGLELMNRAASPAQFPDVQIVGVEKDPTAATSSMIKFAELIKLNNQAQVNICFYSKEANHSLMSTYDSPAENKFWLKSLYQEAQNFMNTGKPIQCSTRMN
jgi:hypothetical protein